jgi:transcriptional regulator with XRE-family HTH domain
LNDNVGRLMKASRERTGLTQAELADRIPLSSKQMSRIERGHYVRIPRATVIRIAEILGEPLVTGEVNLWLALLGYAALIRPGLPLPPRLQEILLHADPVPNWCMDPSGEVVLANRSGRALMGNRDHFNVIHWLLDEHEELDQAMRLGLLRTLFYWVASAAADDWLAKWTAALPESVRGVWRALPLEPAGLTLTPIATGPLVIARHHEAPLRFRPHIMHPTSRPDLLVAAFIPADRATEAWCKGVLAQGPGPRSQAARQSGG